MAEEFENLTLALLRRIDGKIDRLVEDVTDIKRRLTSLELQVAQLHGDFAGQSALIDRIETRLDRIERRLELAPAE
jgi:tetrahydromethanopterin S-methyltransferase subunit G